jgi:hypothetical protein
MDELKPLEQFDARILAHVKALLDACDQAGIGILISACVPLNETDGTIQTVIKDNDHAPLKWNFAAQLLQASAEELAPLEPMMELFQEKGFPTQLVAAEVQGGQIIGMDKQEPAGDTQADAQASHAAIMEAEKSPAATVMDAELAPLIGKAYDICQANGISMLAAFHTPRMVAHGQEVCAMRMTAVIDENAIDEMHAAYHVLSQNRTGRTIP